MIVLEKGRCIYFGPAKVAKQYFLDMGFLCENRKSTPDFLTGVCNPLERVIKSGMEGVVPETSFAFENAWKNSNQYAKSLEDLKNFEKEIEENVTRYQIAVII